MQYDKGKFTADDFLGFIFSPSFKCDVPTNMAIIRVGVPFDSIPKEVRPKGTIPLSDTQGGRDLALMFEQSTLSPRERTKILGYSESIYLHRASGNLNVVGDKYDGGEFFEREQLPVILENSSISSVNSIVKSRLIELRTRDCSPDKALSSDIIRGVLRGHYSAEALELTDPQRSIESDRTAYRLLRMSALEIGAQTLEPLFAAERRITIEESSALRASNLASRAHEGLGPLKNTPIFSLLRVKEKLVERFRIRKIGKESRKLDKKFSKAISDQLTEENLNRVVRHYKALAGENGIDVKVPNLESRIERDSVRDQVLSAIDEQRILERAIRPRHGDEGPEIRRRR